DAPVPVVVAFLATRPAGRVEIGPAVDNSVEVQIDRPTHFALPIAHDEDVGATIAIRIEALHVAPIDGAGFVLDGRATPRGSLGEARLQLPPSASTHGSRHQQPPPAPRERHPAARPP